MLNIGDPAPALTLPSTSGSDVSLSALRGRRVVLYFYPKDDTPGCTRESCDFRDNVARLDGHGAIVFGISRDSIASHEKFRKKHGLPFDLLSDPDASVGRAYGAFGKKMMYGKAVVGTIRSTFLIDEKGRIEHAWSPVNVDGHVDAVLQALAGEGVEGASSARTVRRTASARSPSKSAPANRTSAKSAPAKSTVSKNMAATKRSSPKPALPARRSKAANDRSSAKAAGHRSSANTRSARS
jgi:peroxiredoxin Q/BCP